MSVKERLILFIKSLGIGQGAFEKTIGLSNGYVNNISKGIGADKLQMILGKYPELNQSWLMTGEGEMLCREKEQPTCHTQEGETELSRISDSIRSIAETLERIERKLGK